MGIKYYYSEPVQVRSGYFLANANGDAIYTYPESKLVKFLPRVTICTILDGNSLSFGFSTCSSKDDFCVKRGREIAYNRAINKPYKVVEVTSKEEIHRFSDEITEEIFNKESNRIFGKCIK